MRKTPSKKGFTFIEILIAMTLVAVTFIPLMRMFTVGIENITLAKVMTTAISLGREHMEMVKNLNLPEDRLRKLETPAYFPPKGKPPMEVNGTFWRVKRVVIPDSDPAQVEIYVYEEGDEEPIYSLTTLFEDIY